MSKTASFINSNSKAVEQNPQLAYRPFASRVQKASVAPVTQSTKEDVAFAQQKFKATGLELQAKYGKITPEGQERLTVLQAKMDGLLNSRLKHAKRFSHNFANIPLRRPDTPIQAKLTIGEPGDKYEQEADETARQVVQRIHQPQSEKLQRESLPEEEEELQMKPSGSIQRESLPDEEELQMKPMVQRRVSDGGMAATQDLEASINQARGGGQSLAKNIREPMEQAFGADFSRVKVHTDTQSDQLNRSIQAKAFTTGQDVFFRQGAYQPGSRGGQELLAHELTHVVQQNGGVVQQRQVIQRYSETEEMGKVSENQKLRVEKTGFKLYATQDKLDEANAIANPKVEFIPQEDDPVGENRKLVQPEVIRDSDLDKAVNSYKSEGMGGENENNASEKVRTKVESNYEQRVKRLADEIEDELLDDFDDSSTKVRKFLGVKEKNDLPKKLQEIAKEQFSNLGIDLEAINRRVEEYINKDLTNIDRPLMPSDCRAMASYIAGGVDTESPDHRAAETKEAGKILYYKSHDNDKHEAEWDFHYATIIMTDGGDHVTMENAAAKASEIFSKKQYDHSWMFEMYGESKEQSFDEKYEKEKLDYGHGRFKELLNSDKEEES
ncbi:eCIS core domain-containing protein [Nostoc sp.]|uniref:eCIS core domain-containing protein n=1 Tax=Nostoc sp. TaxID=1180 RepID=UPI002FF8ADE9